MEALGLKKTQVETLSKQCLIGYGKVSYFRRAGAACIRKAMMQPSPNREVSVPIGTASLSQLSLHHWWLCCITVPIRLDLLRPQKTLPLTLKVLILLSLPDTVIFKNLSWPLDSPASWLPIDLQVHTFPNSGCCDIKFARWGTFLHCLQTVPNLQQRKHYLPLTPFTPWVSRPLHICFRQLQTKIRHKPIWSPPPTAQKV